MLFTVVGREIQFGGGLGNAAEGDERLGVELPGAGRHQRRRAGQRQQPVQASRGEPIRPRGDGGLQNLAGSSLRVSFGWNSTAEDADAVVQALLRLTQRARHQSSKERAA